MIPWNHVVILVFAARFFLFLALLAMIVCPARSFHAQARSGSGTNLQAENLHFPIRLTIFATQSPRSAPEPVAQAWPDTYYI
jgi:hypothetical protein